MKLRVLDEAKADALNAMHVFENVRLGLGDAFRSLYESRLQSIEDAPQSFPKYPYAPKKKDVRFTVLKRFRFVIYFEMLADEVLVVAVGHGHRRPGFWQKRRRSN
jgi:toxin ParE1/3/4